jgi:hypothetical protein
VVLSFTPPCNLPGNILKASVSENERANSLLKIMTKRSPNIDLAVLAARVALKGFFGSAFAASAGQSAKKKGYCGSFA